jgi:dsDNA-specific endonuclease/ATPase MutS2
MVDDDDLLTEDAIAIEITDTLDLHTFAPRDVPEVVKEYLEQVCELGFPQVRIIHGKGIGVQRETVRNILSRDPRVLAFRDPPDGAGWGATIVELRPNSGGAIGPHGMN